MKRLVVFLVPILTLFSSCDVLLMPPTTPSKTSPPTSQTPKNPTPTAPTYNPADYSTTAVFADFFKGSVRKEAKTSLSDKRVRIFDNVASMQATLQPDYQMKNYTPRIGNQTPRTDAEDRNVEITTAYLFFASEEEDGDIHLIIGDWDFQTKEAKNVMTAEIAALPQDTTTADFRKLYDARKAFYKQFPRFFESNQKTETFKKWSYYPSIRIRGSLFFDIKHTAGAVGSGNLKPKTAWEIHPVSEIYFYPQ